MSELLALAETAGLLGALILFGATLFYVLGEGVRVLLGLAWRIFPE